MAIPITPVVPHQNPDTSAVGPHANNQLAPTGYQILVETRQTPWLTTWWDTRTIEQIPPESVGWLVAQGWRTTDIVYDDTTKPPTPYFKMTGEQIDNRKVLESLLKEYTFAYNTALGANNVRYNNVLVSWDNMIGSSHDHFIEQVSAQNTHANAYLTDLKNAMDKLGGDGASLLGLITDNQTALVTDVGVATNALSDLDTKLADFEANYTVNLGKVEKLLGVHAEGLDQATFLSDFVGEYVTKLAELATNYGDGAAEGHLFDINALIAIAATDVGTLKSTSDTHTGTTLSAHGSFVTALDNVLTAAGETVGKHLAIITGDIDDYLTTISGDYDDIEEAITHATTGLLAAGEALFALHKTSYNGLVDTLLSDHSAHAGLAKGFLAGLGATELARINEAFAASLSVQLQQLTDRGLYSSAVAIDIRARSDRDRDEEIAALNDRLMRENLENQHQLYGQEVTMRQGTMAGEDHVHEREQALLHYRTQQLLGLHGLQQTVRDRTVAGKQSLYAIRDAFNRFTVDVKTKLYTEGQAMRRTLLDEGARLQTLQKAFSQWQTGQRDQLYNQKQTIVAQNMEGLTQEHTTQQTVFGSHITERDTLLGQVQDTVRGVVTGKGSYAGMTSQNASILTGQRHRMITEKMNEIAVRVDGGQKKHDEDMALMAYQLTERNQLLVGFFGFVERRNDVGPSIADLAALVTSLGDSRDVFPEP